jgi:hypothetical protein
VRDRVRAGSWDAARRLFRDRPEGDTYSQQANVMAVLTDKRTASSLQMTRREVCEHRAAQVGIAIVLAAS